jgi:hypothetical protein
MQPQHASQARNRPDRGDAVLSQADVEPLQEPDLHAAVDRDLRDPVRLEVEPVPITRHRAKPLPRCARGDRGSSLTGCVTRIATAGVSARLSQSRTCNRVGVRAGVGRDFRIGSSRHSSGSHDLAPRPARGCPVNPWVREGVRGRGRFAPVPRRWSCRVVWWVVRRLVRRARWVRG